MLKLFESLHFDSPFGPLYKHLPSAPTPGDPLDTAQEPEEKAQKAPKEVRERETEEKSRRERQSLREKANEELLGKFNDAAKDFKASFEENFKKYAHVDPTPDMLGSLDIHLVNKEFGVEKINGHKYLSNQVEWSMKLDRATVYKRQFGIQVINGEFDGKVWSDLAARQFAESRENAMMSVKRKEDAKRREEQQEAFEGSPKFAEVKAAAQKEADALPEKVKAFVMAHPSGSAEKYDGFVKKLEASVDSIRVMLDDEDAYFVNVTYTFEGPEENQKVTQTVSQPMIDGVFDLSALALDLSNIILDLPGNEAMERKMKWMDEQEAKVRAEETQEAAADQAAPDEGRTAGARPSGTPDAQTGSGSPEQTSSPEASKEGVSINRGDTLGEIAKKAYGTGNVDIVHMIASSGGKANTIEAGGKVVFDGGVMDIYGKDGTKQFSVEVRPGAKRTEKTPDLLEEKDTSPDNRMSEDSEEWSDDAKTLDAQLQEIGLDSYEIRQKGPALVARMYVTSGGLDETIPLVKANKEQPWVLVTRPQVVLGEDMKSATLALKAIQDSLAFAAKNTSDVEAPFYGTNGTGIRYIVKEGGNFSLGQIKTITHGWVPQINKLNNLLNAYYKKMQVAGPLKERVEETDVDGMVIKLEETLKSLTESNSDTPAETIQRLGEDLEQAYYTYRYAENKAEKDAATKDILKIHDKIDDILSTGQSNVDESPEQYSDPGIDEEATLAEETEQIDTDVDVIKSYIDEIRINNPNLADKFAAELKDAHYDYEHAPNDGAREIAADRIAALDEKVQEEIQTPTAPEEVGLRNADAEVADASVGAESNIYALDLLNGMSDLAGDLQLRLEDAKDQLRAAIRNEDAAAEQKARQEMAAIEKEARVAYDAETQPADPFDAI